MRDPAVTSYLPTLLAARTDLQTALNRIDAYERLCAMAAWGVNAPEKQAGAFATVCARVNAAYNRLDLGPTEREALLKQLRALRDERDALRDMTTQLRADKARLIEMNTHLLTQHAA